MGFSVHIFEEGETDLEWEESPKLSIKILKLLTALEMLKQFIIKPFKYFTSQVVNTKRIVY